MLINGFLQLLFHAILAEELVESVGIDTTVFSYIINTQRLLAAFPADANGVGRKQVPLELLRPLGRLLLGRH